MTTADLTTLEAKANKARDAYNKAQAEAEEAQRLEAERQAAELRAADQSFLAGYDDEQLGRDVRRAQQELRAAAAADPVWSAWARVYAAQLRRARLAEHASGVAARLGDNRTVTSRPASTLEIESVLRMVTEIGEDIANAEDSA